MKQGKIKRTIILCMTLICAQVMGSIPMTAAASEKGISIQVEDDGRVLPANQEYAGLICNIKDTYSEMMSITASDGSVDRVEVMTMNLNNIWVSVSGEGTRAFGVPIFSTDIQGSREREAKDKLHHVTGNDCPRLNDGIDAARKEILDGYFQKPLERFLLRYPEISPEEREYTLRLTGGGWTDREEDDTSYWELDYALTTLSEYPDMVKGFVALDTTPLGAQYYSKSDLWWLKQVAPMAKWFPTDILRKSMAKSISETDYSYQKMMSILKPLSKSEIIEQMRIAYEKFTHENKNVNFLFPVLILVGDRDSTGKVKAYCREWAKQTGYPLHFIKNAKHFANGDNPEQVNFEIQQFIRAVNGNDFFTSSGCNDKMSYIKKEITAEQGRKKGALF